MRSRVLLLGAVLLSACNGNTSGLDGGDGGATPDAGFVPADAGFPEDARPLPDAGPRDVGFSDPATFMEGRIDLDGLPTYVLMMGTMTSTMPPLVIVHGGPAYSHEYLLPHLKTPLLSGRMLVFYDQRGTGMTDFGTGARGSTITASQDAIDLGNVVELALRTATNHPPKVDLLGHGYGAGLASIYSARHPEKVSRLVLVTPFPATIDQYVAYKGEEESRITSPEMMRYNMISARPECRDHTHCGLEIWQIFGPHHMCPQNADHFMDLIFKDYIERTDDYIERQLINTAYTWTATLARVQARTTVIAGACDPIPPDAADSYSGTIPGAVRYDFADSGHFPMVESPARFNALIKAALTYP